MTEQQKITRTEAISWVRSHQIDLTFVIAASLFSYMTRELWIAMLVAIFESWYLTFTVKAGPLSGFLNRLRRKLWPSLQELRWQPLLSWLLPTLGILFIVVPAPRVKFWDTLFEKPYERWEIAALTWNLIFSVISYFIVPKFKSRWCQRAYDFILLAGCAGTVWAINSLAAQAYHPPNYTRHLWLVLGVAACYVLADTLVCFDCASEKARLSFLQVLLYADLPTVAALGILLGFAKPKQMNAFLSGAIAFQFIANSLIFALIEGGIFEILAKSWNPLFAFNDTDQLTLFFDEDVDTWLDGTWVQMKNVIKAKMHLERRT